MIGFPVPAAGRPFARLGEHWAAPDWISSLGTRGNALRIAADSSELLDSGASSWDGYVVEVGEEAAPRSVAELGGLVAELLGALAEHDPSGRNCMRLPVETKGWWFRSRHAAAAPECAQRIRRPRQRL